MTMRTDSLADALEREHREIDEGIAAFAETPGDREPLIHAIRALRRHIYLEEEVLFPLLHAAEPALAAPVFVMLREHAQIWALLDPMEQGTDGDATAPARVRQLASHLLHHNMKEEKVLYPRADADLPPAEADRLRTFLSSGEMPAGWICFKARTAG
ncbi:MAG: hemerythrin domain-containing protein [Trebonia sp.]